MLHWFDSDTIYASDYDGCCDRDDFSSRYWTYLVRTDRFYALHRDLVSFCHQHDLTPWSLEDLDGFILDPYFRYEMRDDPLLAAVDADESCVDFWHSFWDACISSYHPTHSYSRFTELEHSCVPSAV